MPDSTDETAVENRGNTDETEPDEREPGARGGDGRPVEIAADGGEIDDDKRRRFLRTVGGTAVSAAGLSATGGVAAARGNSPWDGANVTPVEITHGAAVGEVTADTAVVWARAAEAATVHVEYATDPSFERAGHATMDVEAETDFTGQVRLERLESGTQYYYRVVATSADDGGRGDGGSSSDGRDSGGWWSAGRDDDANAREAVGNRGRGPSFNRSESDSESSGSNGGAGGGASGAVGNETDTGSTGAAGAANGQLAEATVTGTFTTAPAASADEGVTFAWSGDTWGYGNDPVEPPYEGLATIAEMEPDFFLYHGDTIYADAQTPAGKITENTPLDEALEIYREKYKEMRVPPAEVADRTNLLGLLESTSVYVTWDDHEVINNFAGPIEPLMPSGRQAFDEYWPMDRGEDGGLFGRGRGERDDEVRMYDSFRWGDHVELFVLDTRQYRDPNVEIAEKTLLGEEQLAWLKQGLSGSDATWKIVASPAPLGYPSDSWATAADVTGYEAELLELVEHIRTEAISNVVSIAGDVHKSVVGAYDPDDDGEFEFHEATAGPLGAPAGAPDPLYSALNPTEFFAKGEYRNFGTVSVAESGDELTITIYDEAGVEQFSKTIQASDASPARTPDRIESTFDEDTDGWLVSQNGGSNRPEYHATGGNPGGHIGDQENQGGVAWYYQAPFEYLGDREAFYGGTLSFDLRQEMTDQQFDASPTEGGDVMLQSGSQKLIYEFRGPDRQPGEDWTHFEVALSVDEPWIDLSSDDPLATEDVFREVLGNLEVLRIRGEYRSGDDVSYLDNVALSQD